MITKTEKLSGSPLIWPSPMIVDQVWKLAPNLKGHNFLILSQIFVIYISLESYLSLL